jgi:hypothetical protein
MSHLTRFEQEIEKESRRRRIKRNYKIFKKGLLTEM